MKKKTNHTEDTMSRIFEERPDGVRIMSMRNTIGAKSGDSGHPHIGKNKPEPAAKKKARAKTKE